MEGHERRHLDLAGDSGECIKVHLARMLVKAIGIAVLDDLVLEVIAVHVAFDSNSSLLSLNRILVADLPAMILDIDFEQGFDGGLIAKLELLVDGSAKLAGESLQVAPSHGIYWPPGIARLLSLFHSVREVLLDSS